MVLYSSSVVFDDQDLTQKLENIGKNSNVGQQNVIY